MKLVFFVALTSLFSLVLSSPLELEKRAKDCAPYPLHNFDVKTKGIENIDARAVEHSFRKIDGADQFSFQSGVAVRTVTYHFKNVPSFGENSWNSVKVDFNSSKNIKLKVTFAFDDETEDEVLSLGINNETDKKASGNRMRYYLNPDPSNQTKRLASIKFGLGDNVLEGRLAIFEMRLVKRFCN